MKEYTAEFRSSAVALVLEQKYTFRQAADSLKVNDQTLRYWVRMHRQKQRENSSAQELELHKRIAELERENKRLTLERDILKKATAFFAKEQP